MAPKRRKKFKGIESVNGRDAVTGEVIDIEELDGVKASRKKGGAIKPINPTMGVTIADVNVLVGGGAVVDFSGAVKRKKLKKKKIEEEKQRILEEGKEVPPLDKGLKRIGDSSPKKGKVEGEEFWAWDGVRNCDPVQCMYANETPCKYANPGEKCRIQLDYMKYVTRVVTAQMRLLPATDRMKIGFHLMPLYQQLVQFKLVGMVAQPMIYTAKGEIKAHPVFKEIRNIIMTINQVWGTVQIDPAVKRGIKGQMDVGEYMNDNLDIASYEEVCGDDE